MAWQAADWNFSIVEEFFEIFMTEIIVTGKPDQIEWKRIGFALQFTRCHIKYYFDIKGILFIDFSELTFSPNWNTIQIKHETVHVRHKFYVLKKS